MALSSDLLPSKYHSLATKKVSRPKIWPEKHQSVILSCISKCQLRAVRNGLYNLLWGLWGVGVVVVMAVLWGGRKTRVTAAKP